MNLVERTLAVHATELPWSGPFESVLLTPREPTSRYVIAFVHRRGERLPVAVVKLARRAGDRQGLEREARMLEAVWTGLGNAEHVVPALLGLFEADGHTLLVQSVVAGPTLNPARVRRNARLAIRVGADFAAALPVTAPAATAWYEGAVKEPLTRLAGAIPALEHGPVASTHARLARLRSAALPTVLEHGDLSHPNLFLVDRGARLGVVDWEGAGPAGVPGHDLVFYLQFVADAARRATTPPAQCAAFDAAFLSHRGWAVPVLRQHLEQRQVDPELWPQIVLSAWARSAALLLERLRADGPGSEGPAPEPVVAALRARREFVLWQHLLAAGEGGALDGARSGSVGAV